MSDIYMISSIRLQDCTDGVIDAIHRGDTLAAMRNVSATLDALREVSVALVKAGVQEGRSQAAMAQALNVPVSTLRGAKREFGRV